MAEQEAPETGAEEQGAAATEEHTNGTEGELPEAVKQVLAKERKAAKDAERARRAAEAKVKEYEDANKSEQEKLAEEAKSAKDDAAAAQAKALRYEVAAEKGVPLTQAHRLQGTTKDELEADADEFMKDVKGANAGGGQLDGGARTSTPGGDEDMNTLLRRR